MTKRTMVIGTAGAALVGLLTLGAARAAANRPLHGGFGGGEHERIVRAVLDAKFEIACEKLNVTPEQKAKLESIRDGVISDIKAHRDQRRAARDQFLAEFKKDSLSQATLEKLWAEKQKNGEDMRQTVMQAIVKAHDVLTSDQRVQLTDLLEQRFDRIHGE